MLISVEESVNSESNDINNVSRNKCQGNRKSGLNFYDLSHEERKQQGQCSVHGEMDRKHKV